MGEASIEEAGVEGEGGQSVGVEVGGEKNMAQVGIGVSAVRGEFLKGVWVTGMERGIEEVGERGGVEEGGIGGGEGMGE